MIYRGNEIFFDMISGQKKGRPKGICSLCSANGFVLKAAMYDAKRKNVPVLIEATSNQVDQFGGYTGMTPEKFRQYVEKIAVETGLDAEKVILGGDHLGPNAWQGESSKSAMEKAKELVKCYVSAGFAKIHLDASMPCADDPGLLKDEIIAERAAELCESAESAVSGKTKPFMLPVYIIGTEVPVPGGAKEQISGIHITSADDIDKVVNLSKEAFLKRGLKSAWERVIAVVVQPGVEFDEYNVVDYERKKAEKLKNKIETYENLVYEAHSTDYQKKEMLRQMVGDHFAVLKVGPWLTYAFREAVFGLAYIEKEIVKRCKGINESGIIDVLENVMLKNPKYWVKYHHGDENELAFARKFSLSDRIRYYWPEPDVQKALETLISNLSSNPIPMTLLSQFLPLQYNAVLENQIENNPETIIMDKITNVIDIYSFACSDG